MYAWPPAQNTSVTAITPSYLYQQYRDDDNLQGFVAAYNAYAQTYLDYLNTLELPIYTGIPDLPTGNPLLDWVAYGLYGLKRPGLPSLGAEEQGPYNTWVYNSIPFNGYVAGTNNTYYATSDDIYKRILTWLYYKGDGRVFDITWLKRRINRFLNGADGTDIPNDDLSAVSVTVTGLRAYTITLATSAVSTIFAAGVAAGVLELPLQITWTVTLV